MTRRQAARLDALAALIDKLDQMTADAEDMEPEEDRCAADDDNLIVQSNRLGFDVCRMFCDDNEWNGDEEEPSGTER